MRTLEDYERLFWRCGAIRTGNDGKPTLDTDMVPGPMLVAYRLMGGAL